MFLRVGWYVVSVERACCDGCDEISISILSEKLARWLSVKSTRYDLATSRCVGLTALFLAIGGVVLMPARSPAAPINYGSFSGTTVDFTNVTEDSGTDPTPLYGAPTVTGNTMDFDPVSFNAFSQDGSPDITDGTLTFGIAAKAGQSIDLVRFEEAGDFSLLGIGGMETFASATAPVFVNVLEIDGIGIDPIKVDFNLAFQPTDGKYDLTQFGGGPQGQGTWTGNLDVDVLAMLADADISPDARATRLSITMDNTLTALSKTGTSALIAKKDNNGVIITVVPEIPEPTSLALLLVGVVGIVLAGRKRR